MVYSCALGFMGDEMLAEDAVQEAFLVAWTQIGKLRDPAAFPGWLRRIVIWHCHSRRRGAVPTVDIDAVVDRLSDKGDPASEVEERQLVAQAKELMWTLSRPHREILILHYLEQYSHAELSRFLEISEGAVRKRLHDARQNIRNVYERWIKETLRPTLGINGAELWRSNMTPTKPDS